MTRRSFFSRIGAAAIGLTLAAKLQGMASARRRLFPARCYDISIDDYHYGVIEDGGRVPAGVEMVRNPHHAHWATQPHAIEFMWLADGRKCWNGVAAQQTFAAYYDL